MAIGVKILEKYEQMIKNAYEDKLATAIKHDKANKIDELALEYALADCGIESEYKEWKELTKRVEALDKLIRNSIGTKIGSYGCFYSTHTAIKDAIEEYTKQVTKSEVVRVKREMDAAVDSIWLSCASGTDVREQVMAACRNGRDED